MRKLVEKAQILLEALPYIQRFRHKTMVIKYGGAAMLQEELKRSFARDVILLHLVGIRPVIVHGGGPQIGQLLKRLGKESRFVQGLRVTDAEALAVVEMVLGGSINKEIVGLIQHYGGKAVGISGRDGQLLRASKMPDLFDPQTCQAVDLGFVGEVREVNTEILKTLEHNGFIPVIAPIGEGAEGECYNINADDAAGEVAAALRAEKLILLTDVPGILDGHGALVSTLTVEEAEKLVMNEVVTSGMIPKVRACLRALEGGVSKAHILDGRVDHVLLLEVFTEEGVGTQILQGVRV
ncbi:MAG: acetylglutamate kinase [Nitrospinae bacterium]|nr:acetylglutamate kinase [Nitrospinota bacterium]